MEHKTRLSAHVAGIPQRPQLTSRNSLGNCERVAPPEIDVTFMNEGGQPSDILLVPDGLPRVAERELHRGRSCSTKR